MTGTCYYCKKPIKRGGIKREGKLFHKACYGRYKAQPRRVPKTQVHRVRGTLNGHRLAHGYELVPRKRRR